MKKIYLFLAMLLGMFGSTATFAQYTTPDGLYGVDDTQPLITDVSQFSSPFTDRDEGNFYSLIDQLADCPEDQHPGNDFWHSDWHGDKDALGTHYFQVDISSTYDASIGQIVFWFTRRATSDNHIIKWSVRGTNNPDETSMEACEELLLQETPFGNNTESLASNAFDPKDFKYLRFYNAGTNSGSKFFHLSRFNLYPVIDLDLEEKIINKMGDAHKKYNAVIPQFPAGDTPGRYPADKVDAFKAAVAALDADLAETLPATLEDVDALIQAAEDALTTLKDTPVVPFSLETGYYRVVALWYTDGEPRYMGGDLNDGQGLGVWGEYDDLDDPVTAARTLWYIENKGNGTYDMVSQYNDGRFTEIARSTNVVMDKNSSSLVAFDLVTTDDDGHTFVNIRIAADVPEEGQGYFNYLHQGGHNNGGGTGGNLVGWERTWDWNSSYNEDDESYSLRGSKASEWTFEPVDESEAQQIIADFEPYKNKFVWLDDFRHMIEESKPLIEKAKDLVDTTQPLITSADQLGSPCSDSAEGQHIEYLIDGNTGTFWHTSWHPSDDTGPDTYHYLQVELPEDAPAVVAFGFTRRGNADNDHTTKWSVYGFSENNFDLTMDDGNWLFDAETPFTSKTETLVTEGFATEGYKYLRFYSMEQAGASYGSRTYWHASEFQVYPALLKPAPTSQYAQMGDVAKTLEDLIEEYEFAENDDLEYPDYEKLKAAYDAFMGYFVDPTDFRQAIKNAEAKLKSVVVGTAPGFYTNESRASLADAVAQARAYDAAGTYSQSEINSLMGAMESAVETIDDKIIPIKTGKWYRLRFGTEEEYDQYSWPKTGNFANYWKNTEEYGTGEDNMYNEALFGKYMTVAKYDVITLGQNDEGNDVRAGRISAITKDEVALNYNIFADADEDIEDKDMAMWRFIKQGEGYVIQNKATGLFMRGPGNLTLSPSPTVFQQHGAGYGQNAFFATRLDGEYLTPMHCAQSNNILALWGGHPDDQGNDWRGYGNSDGRRGCFFVEEAGDVAGDYDGSAFQIEAKPGTLRTYCFPVTIKAAAGMYGVKDVTVADEISITLVPITEANPGRPFIFITEGDFDAAIEDDEVKLPFTHGMDIVTTPQQWDIFKGTFYGEEVGGGVIVTEATYDDPYATDKVQTGYHFAVTQDLDADNNTTTVGDHRGWIVAGTEEGFEDVEVLYEITAGPDGIQNALQNVARKGAIYTVDGRHIGNGNINDLKQKGIYIINGTKVVVK